MSRAAVRRCVLVFLVVGSPCLSPAQSDQTHNLGQPGYLVIEAARDSAAGFAWDTGADPGTRSLIWDEGRLTIFDPVIAEDFGRWDLGIPCTEFLAGSGSSGSLVIRDGIFPVSEPVVLTDGLLELQLTGGELEVRGAVIRYRRPASGLPASKSGLLLLAGMTLLIIVLLRRARMKSGERRGS
ncbi:MAG: hypothetical protein ABFS42_01365 [Candidatus Krumholzibacteriota bacterium]